jgi:N-formylglutamate deformylase
MPRRYLYRHGPISYAFDGPYAIAAAAQAEGYSVAADTPFSGALVPLASYRKDRRIMSVMIEVNRRLYMDEDTGFKNRNFDKVGAAVGRLIVTATQAAAP